MTTTTTTTVDDLRRVRVWFGDHAIVDFIGAPDLAERYAAAMRRRFISLPVTNDSLPSSPGDRQP